MNAFRIYLYGPSAGPPAAHPLTTSFEEAAERLGALSGSTLEPDGSFACVAGGGREQIYGMLYDSAGRLQYVELQGHATRAFCRKVVAAIAGEVPERSQLTVLQLPEQALKSFQAFEAAIWH